MMRAERQEHNELHNDQSNGYRSRKAFGHGRVLELTVPRTRHGNLYPVLLSVLKDQRAEMDRFGFSLCAKGLTTKQVGEVLSNHLNRLYSRFSKPERRAEFSGADHQFCVIHLMRNMAKTLITTIARDSLNGSIAVINGFLKMSGAVPNEPKVPILMDSVAINKEAYERKLPAVGRESSFSWLYNSLIAQRIPK